MLYEVITVGLMECIDKVDANNVRKIREGLLMSKAELARRAGLSVLTIDRVEKGMTCRMDTKRKIILSLGLQLSDRDKVFSKNRITSYNVCYTKLLRSPSLIFRTLFASTLTLFFPAFIPYPPGLRSGKKIGQHVPFLSKWYLPQK